MYFYIEELLHLPIMHTYYIANMVAPQVADLQYSLQT